MEHLASKFKQKRNSIEARSLAIAGNACYEEFERTGVINNLEEAIGHFQQALSLTPDGHPDKREHLINLGNSFQSRFERTGLPKDLEEVIRNQQHAMSLTSDDDPDKPIYLTNLGNSFESRFRFTGLLVDLEEATRYCQQAVLLTPDDHPNKPRRLNNLGSSFHGQFKRSGLLKDLEEAIRNQEQAVSLVPDNHPEKAIYLNSLGTSFKNRFGRTGVLSDLEEAIRIQMQAVSLTPDDHPYKPMHLNGLGISFETRFRRTGLLNDLEEAIKNQQQAVSLTPDGHPHKPQRLYSLGNSFENRFRRTGLLNDLGEAIRNKQQGISLTPDDHPNKPAYLSSLGSSFESRFGRTWMVNDLEEAIRNQQRAVLLTPDNHPDKPIFLYNLGTSFQSRFRRTGMLDDLEGAIRHKRQAASLTPDDHPDKPLYLDNIGISFRSRFSHTGLMNDIEEAIRNQQRAVSLVPDDHPEKAKCLDHLGSSFEMRFGRTGMLNDLEQAIKNQRQAVSLTPEDHSDKPLYLNNLGVSFESHFRRTGLLNDIEEAIRSQQQAVSLTPDGHPDKLAYLDHLGNSFESRFRRTGLLDDLEEAIKNQQRAVSLTHDDHPNKPNYLNNLGDSLESRFKRTGTLRDLDEAISNYHLAATSKLGPILPRCLASWRWARLEAQRDPPSAPAAYRHAIKLFPQLAWIGDPIATRHSQLTYLGDLPREAAAFALDAGHPDLALEWLEQGRSVVWNQLLLLRTSADRLSKVHPDIGVEFTRTSHELRGAATRGHTMTTSDAVECTDSLEEEIQHHHRLAEKWDSLVQKIQSLPGFGDFLLPKPVSALKQAAGSGPIVVINVHDRRCDALVLDQSSEEVLHIPLDRLRYRDLQKMQKSMKQYLANYRAQRWTDRTCRLTPMTGLPMAEILKRLYLNIVCPILQRLGMMTGISDPLNLPHIWWCPTGPLTFLPLHAACHKTGDKIDGTFNYVVSSYIPTVNALLEARAMKKQPFDQLVGIAMTNTPGLSSLPCVAKEIAVIEKVCSDKSRVVFETLRNEEATSEQVLTHMAKSSWVHLACHAAQDKEEPTQSGFCLHDRRLNIMDIISKPFDHADLAFLSACQTATGDEKTSDEAVHITGAMLGAGYRNAIGTMWTIPDEVAPLVAEKVYEILLSGDEPNSDNAARALHEAVKRVRESGHGSFHRWVPFVHYGT